MHVYTVISIQCPLLSRVQLFVTRRTSLPGFSVHGILQARILEWVAISFWRSLPNPGIEPGLLHCRQTLYHVSHQGRMPVQVIVRDTGLISRLGRSLGGGHQNPLQFSCLENPMDRGAWQATAIGSQTIRYYWSEFTHTHTHTHTHKMSGEKNRNYLSFVWRKDFQPKFKILWIIKFK